MTAAPYRHIGGAIAADHGRLSLAAAAASAGFYAQEVAGLNEAGTLRWARVCAEREEALRSAISEARRWRRAAGWADPDKADRYRGADDGR